uniref:Asialoglycoprotein receptor-like 1 n=1 Tax=Scophthalmus maximus TaxID=52904 RepID=A0A8D3B9H5_SCOMX
SQLNKEITEVKVHLERISHGGKTSASSAGEEMVFSLDIAMQLHYRRPLFTLLLFGVVSSSYRNLPQLEVKTENCNINKNPNSVAVFFCTKTILIILLKPGTCGNGWSSFQRSCYLLSTSPVTWSKAEEQCRAHGGHLLRSCRLARNFYTGLRYSYWIGLVEREHEGHWSWVDGTDFHSTPTFWDKGQPDNWDYRENGEDCGQLHASERRKRKMWNDADCSLWYQYICEAVVPL